nr:PAS domain S-box protein [Chloroflexota bacterium]
ALDIVMITDANGTIRYISPSVERVLGYQPEELIGTSSALYVHPDDLQRSLEELAEAASKPGVHPVAVETRVRHKDGSWRLLEGIANNLLNDPAVRGMVFNHRDVTERKQAEEAIRASEDRFRSLVQYASDIVTILDADGTIRYESPAIERILGYRPEELIGQNAFDYIHPEDVERVLGVFAEALKSRAVSPLVEFRFRHTDGSWCHLEAIGNNLLDDPNIRGMVVNSRDVTGRKRAEEEIRRLNEILEKLVAERTAQLEEAVTELRASEERFRALVQHASDIIAVLDRDGTIRYMSPSVEQVLGYRPEEMIGKDCFVHMHPEDVERMAHVFAKEASRPGLNPSVEFRVRHADGSWRHLEAISNNLLHDPAVKGIVVNSRDATERRRAEEEIRLLNQQLERRVIQRTNELQAAIGELESFSYSVSHDLRAPLRAIDGFSQILLEDYADELDEEGKSYLGRIRNASQRLGWLIDGLLDLSRMTRGEMRRERVDLSALAKAVAEDLRHDQPERQAEFVISEDLLVSGDPVLLRAVMENLLGNAWKFTKTRSRARIEFGVSEADGTPAYFVRDNGIGFDMAYAGKLFGAFQRLHSSSEFEGTGIGLATVQRIIHRHGGRVWTKGEVGVGATFFFTL